MCLKAVLQFGKLMETPAWQHRVIVLEHTASRLYSFPFGKTIPDEVRPDVVGDFVLPRKP